MNCVLSAHRLLSHRRPEHGSIVMAGFVALLFAIIAATSFVLDQSVTLPEVLSR